MNKKTLTYLVVLVVLVIIYLIASMDSSQEKRFNFFTADSNSVARIEIAQASDTLHLAKQGFDWIIDYPVTWQLQVGKMEKIFDTVLRAEASTIPVSENVASLEKYSLLDSLATHFKTYDTNGKILDDVLVGKSSSYSVTPVRKLGSNEVFLLETNIASIIKPVLGSWRRREIIEIDPEQITKFMVVSDDVGYTLTQSDSLWEYADEIENFFLEDDNSTLNSIKSSFKRFAASDFVDGKFDDYATALQNPSLQLGIEMWNGDTYYLRYAPYEDKKYVVQLNNDTQTLYVQYESNMNKFIKKAEDFK
jgi:hypothetical protein